MDFTNVFNGPTGKPAGGIGGFDAADAAAAFTPLPAGVYTARVTSGEVCSTKAGADAYRLRFEIAEGPLTGKTLVRTWTFGEKAIQYTKRDLAAFGLTTSARLLSPFPETGKDYLVRLVVALQRGEDGVERNDVKRIDVVRVAGSPAAAFMLGGGDEGGHP